MDPSTWFFIRSLCITVLINTVLAKDQSAQDTLGFTLVVSAFSLKGRPLDLLHRRVSASHSVRGSAFDRVVLFPAREIHG